jgi:5-(carboxyamino)imidazole ribonucleotide mutase
MPAASDNSQATRCGVRAVCPTESWGRHPALRTDNRGRNDTKKSASSVTTLLLARGVRWCYRTSGLFPDLRVPIPQVPARGYNAPGWPGRRLAFAWEQTNMADVTVAIIMGSDSDWPVMEACHQQLKSLGIGSLVEVISAHRTPDRLREFVVSAEQQGVRVFITAAGMAAALPGVVAAYTTAPVIGVPLASGTLQGIDSLLSIVQMPPGVPVATVAIGSAGAKNAAILAAQMLALSDARLKKALVDYRSSEAESVVKKSQSLKDRLARA